MSVLRKWAGWVLGVGGILVFAGAGAAAQVSIFSSALQSSLSVGSSDALPILVLADVGSMIPPYYAPDGNLDLITADQSGQKVWVYFGNGDGTFGNGFSRNLNRTPTALALGDFDGVPDLAVTDTTGNVVLLHGNGDGTFSQPGPAVPIGFVPVTPTVPLAAVDVNNDKNLDLVIVNSNASAGGVTVLLGDGKGGFFHHCSLSTSNTCTTNDDCPSDTCTINYHCSLSTSKTCTTNDDCPGDTCTPVKSSDLPHPGGSAIGVVKFNGDYKVDIAVANGNTNSVVILEGDGYGNFSVLEDIPESPGGEQPVAIAVGDLNNDERLDIVVANQGSDNIGVLLGQADGTFRLQGVFDSGTANSSPNGVALLDANGDGKLDVAVSNKLSFDVSVLLGDGKGNFGTPRAFVTDQEPLTVAAGNLNGDSIPDLVALNRDNNYADAVVLLGQGDGSFIGIEDVIVNPTPNAVIAGDIDNDGLADLIVAHPTGTLLVRRAQPSGGFAAPLTLQAAGDPVAIGCGDFNGDGRLDIVALNKSPANNVSMFLGQGNGFSTTPPFPVGAGGVALTVGDWDGDGRPDLAVARQGTGAFGAVDILLSNADGSLRSLGSLSLSSNPVAIDWGDFNKDGNLDLAVVSPFGTCSVTTSQTCNVDTDCTKQNERCNHQSKITVALGNGKGAFQAGIDIPIAGASSDARTLAVADFDGNGFDDIAVLLAPPDNKVVVFYGSGGMNFTAGNSLTFGSNNVWDLAARDISGDLLPDLVMSVQGVGVNAVYAFVSQGASFDGAVASVPVNRSPTSIIAADFDGDGRYDVASAANNIAGTVSVLTNIGATPPIIRGDANGDGKVTAADLLAVASKLRDGAATRVEQAGNGLYHVKPGADANGDGLVTAQDVQAIAHRLFPRI